MIDGFKIGILPPLNNIGEGLKWYTTTDEDGQIIKRFALDKGFNFTVKKEKYLLCTGSFHKAFNNGNHNYNKFNFQNLLKVLTEFNQRYKIPLSAKLQNIECGFNIKLPFSVEDFLNTLIMYNSKPFNIIREKNFNYYQIAQQRFFIKIYDKALQYNLTDNILRIEIKVIKMKHIEKTGIITLFDLMEIDKIKKLANILLTDFNQLITCKSVFKINNSKERDIINKGLSFNYWYNLKQLNTSKYDNTLKKFKSIIEKYNLNSLQKEISKLLADEINSLCIVLNSVKQCKVTKLDISMQKDSSNFLCTTGIKWYLINKPEIFVQLEKRLSDKWSGEPIEIKIKEIHHSIRNEYYNVIHNNKRDIINLLEKEKIFPTLFNNKKLIEQNKLRLTGL